MVIFIKGFSRTARLVVMVNITGKTRATSRATSPTAFEPAKGFGNVPLASPTNTKASTKTTKNGVTVSSHGPTATFSKETTKAISEMAMAKCTGPMEATTKVNGKMGFRMEKVFVLLIQVNCLY